MKIIVQWEDSREKEYADNLVEVLARMGGTLASNARVDGNNVTMKHDYSSSVPRVQARSEPAPEAYEAAFGLPALEPPLGPMPEPPHLRYRRYL